MKIEDRIIYKIEVFDDGDIFVTKIPRRQAFEANLCLEDLGSVKSELESYGVEDLEKDITEIANSKLYEAVRCF